MEKSDKLSDHLTLGEFTKSQNAIKNGIANMPTSEHLENAKKWALHIYEPLRKKFGAIFVSVGYRSKELNTITPGASLTSYHCSGRAGDLDDTFGNATNKEVFMYILENLEFAELIWEYGNDENPDWVHVAYHEGKNVKEVLRARKAYNQKTKQNETKYEIWKP